MVMTFHELMSRIRNASGDDFVLRIDIAGALNLLVGSTSKSLLKGSSDRKDTSVQPIFMKEVLNYANEHPEDTCALLYWETAVALDLNEFSSDELKATQKIIMDNVDNVIAIAGGKSGYFSLQEAEVADRLTELRERYNQTSARSRRRTPKSSNSTPVRPGRITTIRKKKASTSVKRTTQQLIDGQETPSPPPVTNSLVTPVARTRPVLSRSAKSAAFSKTRRWLFEKNDEDELT
ncbi:hypothetical protein NECAME_03964 [Necator americanus]|uniref:Uncharacterized protein n=1 Tax=Necator americanus TaxID=51031 RepID=W2SYE1_NECAM|nr:hypothetical protein NECAME_03964 [Necator americanus]ETN74650.1 hypothetical protein NECAME_03964 [Necator americanus]